MTSLQVKECHQHQGQSNDVTHLKFVSVEESQSHDPTEASRGEAHVNLMCGGLLGSSGREQTEQPQKYRAISSLADDLQGQSSATPRPELRIIDLTQPASIVRICRLCDNIDHSGMRNLRTHDKAWFWSGGLRDFKRLISHQIPVRCLRSKSPRRDQEG